MNDDDDLVFLNHGFEDENAAYLTEQQRNDVLNETAGEELSELDDDDLETTIRLAGNNSNYWLRVFG